MSIRKLARFITSTWNSFVPELPGSSNHEHQLLNLWVRKLWYKLPVFNATLVRNQMVVIYWLILILKSKCMKICVSMYRNRIWWRKFWTGTTNTMVCFCLMFFFQDVILHLLTSTISIYIYRHYLTNFCRRLYKTRHLRTLRSYFV